MAGPLWLGTYGWAVVARFYGWTTIVGQLWLGSWGWVDVDGLLWRVVGARPYVCDIIVCKQSWSDSCGWASVSGHLWLSRRGLEVMQGDQIGRNFTILAIKHWQNLVCCMYFKLSEGFC